MTLLHPGVIASAAAAVYGWMLAVTFENPVTTAVGLATIAAGIVGAAYAAKRKSELDAARGAADAWKTERDAATSKAERLEAEHRRLVAENARLAEMTNIQGIAEALEKAVERTGKEHRAILDALREVVQEIRVNTEAIKFLATQRAAE